MTADELIDRLEKELRNAYDCDACFAALILIHDYKAERESAQKEHDDE